VVGTVASAFDFEVLIGILALANYRDVKNLLLLLRRSLSMGAVSVIAEHLIFHLVSCQSKH